MYIRIDCIDAIYAWFKRYDVLLEIQSKITQFHAFIIYIFAFLVLYIEFIKDSKNCNNNGIILYYYNNKQN